MFDKKTIRNNGIFYTPTLFVDYAHKMISEQLGDNWKDEYVVWDNCCGGKNLTRDYKFKELYCSTLFESELKISDRYNKEATSFQFDFLNDYIPMPDELVQGETKIPQGLLDAFKENKKIVFFLNPPYATAANGKDTDSKTGCAKTKINKEMVDNGYGNGSRNLYAQFLYHIMRIKEQYKLTNVYIALFCKPNYLSSPSYEQFRADFLKNFNFINGVLFNAGEFADVSTKWGINFTIWGCDETEDKNNFEHTLISNIDGNIENIGDKNVYNADKLLNASEWAKYNSKNMKIEQVYMTSAIKIKDGGNLKAYTLENSLGGFVNSGNNVYTNAQQNYIISGSISTSTGAITHIMKDNFTKCTALFSARKLIVGNWINDKDEYLAPNESHPKFNEFVNDSVIYSLFNTASNQSSLRQIEYKGKLWDIKNEFFWMSKEEIANFANEYQLDAVYEDAKTSNERYVYQYIQEHKSEFSKEAIAVLDKAIELTKKSFKYRQLFADEHPEYQLDKCWDAGFYQLKAIWKEFMKDDFENFKQLYKALGDKMRPMVYELGFLK